MLYKHNQCLVSLKVGRGAISKEAKFFFFFISYKYIYPGAKNIHLSIENQFLQVIIWKDKHTKPQNNETANSQQQQNSV